jgi:tRNA threonylcarbamoyladenosine biosynthesis protein TsaB
MQSVAARQSFVITAGARRVKSGFATRYFAVNILALESSTELCSVALWRDGRIEAREAEAGQRNSEVLLPMVDALLAAHAVGHDDLDGIAFGAGPGAFTGLRVACGVAQGIAFGRNLPVVGVVSLRALAEAAQASRVVCCLDARMGEIYHAAYERDGDDWREVCAPDLCKPEAAPALPGTGWCGCGSGFAAFGDVLERRYDGVLDCVLDGVVPHARAVAALAARAFARGEAVAAELAAPLYVRNKVALRVNER